MRFVSFLVIAGMFFFRPSPAASQDLPWWKNVEHWCIRYSLAEERVPPCNELSHSAVTFALTLASFQIGLDGLNGWVACLPGGAFALGKEVIDIGRWGLGGQLKSTLLDLTFSAGGCLLARRLNRKGKAGKIDSPSSQRVSFFTGTQGVGIRLTF